MNINANLFRAITRSARKAAHAPSLWNALKNGAARISCESIASADLQHFVIRLEEQRMLNTMVEARFRANPVNHRSGRGEAGALDEAFTVLRNFNTVFVFRASSHPAPC